jgi:NTE family protein
MERKRVGLALSGGVLRGAAHIGVLMALEEAGIPIDCVAGVSAGSIVGSLYCAGITTDQMLARSHELGWCKLASVVWPREGFISFAKLGRWLIDIIGDRSFSDLMRPFAVVVTDVATGVPVLWREGKVARAVHASCAVPGFIVPVKHQGRVYGDGGVSCNLPAFAARVLGADYVIGVDLMQPQIRQRGGPFRYGFAALETLVERSGGGLEAVDCLIAPPLAGMSYLRVSQFDDLVARGRHAAEAQLDRIRAALAAG